MAPAEAAIAYVRQATQLATASFPNYSCALDSAASAGELILTIVTFDGNNVTSVAFTDADAELYDHPQGGGNTFGAAAWFRAAGGETAQAIVASGAGANGACHVYRISGDHASTAPEAGTAAEGGVSDPDPPSLNPSGWGTEETQWIAVAHVSGAVTVNTYPTGYADGLVTNVTGNSGGVVTATLLSSIASSDPTIFDLASGTNWVTQTIAVRPAAAAQGTGLGMMGIIP